MAEVRPLQALHYDLAAVPSLADVTAPPYDVIDAELRARAARALAVQRRRDRPARGARRAATPTSTPPRRSRPGRSQGVLTADREPAIWAADPGVHGARRQRRGRGAGSSPGCASTDYGPGRVRPHERTQPGPKEDRLRLTRATAPQPVADLRASPRRRLDATSRPPARRRPLGRGHRRRRHRPPRLARRRPRGPRGGRRGARRRRAADRRRPPPLRDRAHLRRRDRRRGPAPLHADVPRLARRPRPHGLSAPTACSPASTRASTSRSAPASRELFEVEEVPTRRASTRGEEGVGVFGYIDSHLKRGFRLRLTRHGGARRARCADRPRPTAASTP